MRLLFGASLSVVNSGTCVGDPVERIGRGLGIDRRDHDRVGPGGHKVIHQRVLQGGRALRGIAELQIVAGQFVLRGGNAGFGQFPEVRGRVHDEGKLRLVLGKDAGAGKAGRQAAARRV